MTITLLAPDGVPVTAQQERQAKAAQHGGGSGRQLGGRSGFRVGIPTGVLSVTSTTWTLGPCAAMIDPGASTHQGVYGWSSDANITGSLTAADATYARKDIVYIQVNDSSAGDGSGALNADVLYLAGPMDGTNVPPALPVRSFLVGTISVPVAGGGSPTAALNPARYVAAGAPIPVDLAARDALNKYDMLTVQRTDLVGRPLEVWDGTEWQRYSRTYARAAGVATIGGVGAGGTAGPFAQTFPAGRFTVPPVVIVTTDQTRLQAAAANVTATGFNLYMTNLSAGSSDAVGQMRWIAEQMTATSATG